MRAFKIVLWLSAPVFLLVGTLHLILGLGADVLLGAKVGADTLSDPGLDSQNRFYGVAFTLYGVLLALCATDVSKYALVLRCLLGVFFAAGAARLISIAMHGMPPAPILALLGSELFLPPLLFFWLQIVVREADRPMTR